MTTVSAKEYFELMELEYRHPGESQEAFDARMEQEWQEEQAARKQQWIDDYCRMHLHLHGEPVSEEKLQQMIKTG